CGGLYEPCGLKRCQHIGDAARWVLEGGRRLADHVSNGNGTEIDQVQDEVVRVLCLDLVRRQGIRREGLEVARDDDLRSAADGGGQNMTVPGIGKLEAGDQRGVAVDEAVPDSPGHELAGTDESGWLEIGTVGEMLRKHSSRISLVQRARTRSVWAIRISRSRNDAGYSTHAS